MIFGIGVVLFLVGSFIVVAYGTNSPFRHNAADYWGAGAVVVGFVMALGSLLHFIAKVLA